MPILAHSFVRPALFLVMVQIGVVLLFVSAVAGSLQAKPPEPRMAGEPASAAGQDSGQASSGETQSDRSYRTTGRTTRDPLRGQPNVRSRLRINLTGRVVLDSGEPAPSETAIQRVCHGQTVIEGYANSKGEFSIFLGQNSQLFSDASTGASTGGAAFPGAAPVDLRSLPACEIRAFLPGYQSSSILLASRRSSSSPDLGVIVLSRLAHVEGLTVSFTTLRAPKKARAAWERGMGLLREAKFQKALLEFEKAIAEYPQFAVAHYGKGQSHEGLRQFDRAAASYRLSVQHDDKYLLPYLRLAVLAADREDWSEAADFSAKAIKLNPVDFPFAYYLNSLSNLQLQRFDLAERSARQAKQMDASNQVSRLDYILALCLASRQQYAEAASFLRAYLASGPEDADVSLLRQQLSQLEQSAAREPSASGNP
jgi:tetratricopeptide (TPR) repeat protein